MTIFPLDATRNAVPSQVLEPVLESVREQLAAFPFVEERDEGDVDAVLEAFDMARPRLNIIASLLQDLRGARGADISTGLGFLPPVLRRLGLDVSVTETGDEQARFAVAAGAKVHPYQIGRDRPPFEAGSMQYVVFSEVLEHLRFAPMPTIREIAGLLAPGGRLILTTPNIARLEHVELLAAGESFLEPVPLDLAPRADALESLEHVREYSVREVVDAIENAGLAVESVLMTGWGEDGYHPRANPFSNGIIVCCATA